MFDNQESFAIALSPEGTRKKVTRLRTGFYYISKKANLPIIMLALDFAHREFRFSDPFYTTNNVREDLAGIIRFFSKCKG